MEEQCLWVLEPDSRYEVLSNRHDKGYKYLLSAKKVFVQLLKSFVRQDWVHGINEDSVEQINRSFMLQDFNSKEADLIYKVRINGKEVFFYILLELQSTVDYRMPYRLLQYMLEIWRAVLKDTGEKGYARKDFRLPLIVPCVIYNGQYNWTACTSFKELLSGKELFDDYILDFKYILFDVARYGEEELLQLGNLIGAVFYIDQKPRYDEIIARLKKLVDLLNKLSKDEFNLFKVWLKNVATSGMTEKETMEIERIIDESKEVDEMIYAMEIALRNMREEMKLQGLEEGIKKGRIEGKAEAKIEIAKKMLAIGMDIEKISLITGLSEDEIRKLGC